jgi:hypothetical protein
MHACKIKKVRDKRKNLDSGNGRLNYCAVLLTLNGKKVRAQFERPDRDITAARDLVFHALPSTCMLSRRPAGRRRTAGLLN